MDRVQTTSLLEPARTPTAPAHHVHVELIHPEIQSQAELNSTQVSPATAKVLSILFVAAVFILPVLDLAVQVARRQQIQAADVLRPVPQALRASMRGESRQALRSLQTMLTGSFLHSYEEELGNHSLGKQSVQPRLQSVVTGLLGFGNDKTVVGRNGWLYYQPGLDYLSGGGILDPDRLRLKAQKMSNAGESDWHPDPREAIVRFHRDCKQAGVRLMVVPIPDKVMLQPAQLTRRMAFDAPVAAPNNIDWGRFVRELRDAGVDVFDAVPSAISPQDVRYLAQDTHWTPQFMQEVAASLAAHLQQSLKLSPGSMVTKTEQQHVSRLGDLVGMLKMPATQAVFVPQQVNIEQVQFQNGAPWMSDPNAEIVLLGDSFTNIYSDGAGDKGLGWGESAGFAPHLSRCLGRPIDVIARNGSGASITRAELARRPDPFGGKKIIVWEFAVRDLTSGDWQVIPMTRREAAMPAVSDSLVVDAELLTAIPAEAKQAEVYTSALVVAKFRVTKVVAGKYDESEILVKLPSILNRNIQPAADLQPGQRVRLRVQPEVPAAYASLRVIDRTREMSLPSLWCEGFQKLP